VLGPDVVTMTVGVVLFTVWVNVAVVVLLFASPLYVAMIGSAPIGRVAVLTVATPFAKADVPRTVEPLVKVTVPVAFDGRDAVKTTD
jgi:hypothetical protein